MPAWLRPNVVRLALALGGAEHTGSTVALQPAAETRAFSACPTAPLNCLQRQPECASHARDCGAVAGTLILHSTRFAIGNGRSARPAMPMKLESGFAAGFAVALLCAAGAAPAVALDCTARWLDDTDIAVCRDPQLSRNEEQITRRIGGFARRVTFGQYLSLRHWHALWSEERARCSLERACIAASYRVQARLLDRLQQCLDVSQQRRQCFRTTLNAEREALRR
jgi:hypothetical protein